jgi:hypothetical protein
MFWEMCLPEKIAQWIKQVETVPAAWALLDAVFNNSLAFVQDLMQDIQAVSEIMDDDYKRKMEFYST